MSDNPIMFIDKRDFIVKITPQIEGDKWTGEIDVSLIHSKEIDLPNEDIEQLTYLANLVASSIPVMETDEFVRETLHNYVMQMVGEEYEDEQEPYTDNVVPLTFESKTRGNA